MSKRAKSTWIYCSIMALLLIVGLPCINNGVGVFCILTFILMAFIGVLILINRYIFDTLTAFRDWWHRRY